MADYQFSQTGDELQSLFNTFLAWLDGATLQTLGNIEVMGQGGDVIADGHRLSEKADEQAMLTLLAQKYVKPVGGIPKTDLAAAVQSSLNKADSALQSHQDISNLATKQEVDAKYTKPGSGIPKTDLAAAVQQSLDRADTALQSHQNISGKATVIDLSQYVNSRIPTPEYQLSDNYMPYYTWGDYPIQQWGVIVETDEESNNDFYYVAMFSPDGGATIEYLAFSNKGDWGLLGGNTGIFTEENVPNSILKALNLSMKLSNESIMDALPSTFEGKALRVITENGASVWPVTHAAAVILNSTEETTVEEEIVALKNSVTPIFVEYWDDEATAIHKDSAADGDLFFKTDEGVLYEYYYDSEDEQMQARVKTILPRVYYNSEHIGIGHVDSQNNRTIYFIENYEVSNGLVDGLISATDKRKIDAIYAWCVQRGMPAVS